MSQIKGKDTKPELLVRRFLFSKGFRFRLHSSNMPGKPDIILKKYKTVIFVHGCFWHSHKNCKYANTPKTNTAFWKLKLQNNLENDCKVFFALKKAGWNIIEVWGCELKKSTIQQTFSKLPALILSKI